MMRAVVELRSVMAGFFLAGLPVSGAPAACAKPAKPQVFEETLPSPSMSGHFSLHRVMDGKAVSDAQFRGKWMLVYFGYTNCPDVCPTVLNEIGVALNELGPRAKKVQPIF